MADYLIHFNPYHDPKTGRFDFNNNSDARSAILSEQTSKVAKNKKDTAIILGGGIGTSAILGGLSYLTKNPVLFSMSAKLATGSTIVGGSKLVQSFIESSKLKKMKKEFAEMDLEDKKEALRMLEEYYSRL